MSPTNTSRVSRHNASRHYTSSNGRPSNNDRYSQATSNTPPTTTDGGRSSQFTSQYSPYSPHSPSGTQATSFLTVDSDERDASWPGEQGPPRIGGAPQLPDLDRSGGGYSGGFGGMDGAGDEKTSSVKTAISCSNGCANGRGCGTNGYGNGNADGKGRVISRKSSRFFRFWKKRGETNPPSPEV